MDLVPRQLRLSHQYPESSLQCLLIKQICLEPDHFAFQIFASLPIVLHIIVPTMVFLNHVVAIFIHVPYNGMIYLLDTLFPLYIFCYRWVTNTKFQKSPSHQAGYGRLEVACITGSLLGLTGHILCQVVIHLMGEERGAPASFVVSEEEIET